jgi:hypothetical protein
MNEELTVQIKHAGEKKICEVIFRKLKVKKKVYV